MTQHTDSSPDTVVAVVNDLMFGSKIRGAAGRAGVALVLARSPEELREHAATARLVLLDLNTRWLDAPAEIRVLRAEPATRHVRIITFGSHVAAEALMAAREAGADRVLANSAFVQQLDGLLRG